MLLGGKRLHLGVFRFWCSEAFSHGVPFERELVSVVHQAIENRISQRGITDRLVPMLDRKLAGDNSGAAAVAVFEQFEHVMSAGIIKLRQPPIIKNDEIGFGQSRHDFGIAPIALGRGHLLQESGQTGIEHAIAFTAGFLAQGTG